ncbi:hypothetical protein KKP04_07295 [Rhodomicrobium sp. Az07]|uniref:hypothetical protein n=1 Tax=Rhodomicrobium sp. Az07 TaxID=2839034 RepID=UPI001BEB7A70|nr:hypothetical protein [Rhodomicrobium sp. Az07]MBT3070669.1 hypothetical protein [Rhodomicrobium sp. Az07]
MWNVIAGVLAAVIGAGFGAFAKSTGILGIDAGPFSVVFMFLSLVLISLIFQFRVNMRDRGDGRGLRIAPPSPDIMIEAAIFFAAALTAMQNI